MTPALPDILRGNFMCLAIPAPVESQGEFMTGRVGVIALLSLLAAQEVERGTTARVWENGAISAVLGAYALAQARRNPEIGVVFPSDHTLVLSRLQLIARRAARPNAARLWLDYTLSQRGQALIERQGIYAVRADVKGEATAAQLSRQLGATLRPIVPGADLTHDLRPDAYRDFIRRWRSALGQPLRGA